MQGLKIDDITEIIIGSALKIHKDIGPGLFESVYEFILEKELQKQNLQVDRQKNITFRYEDIILENAFRVDLLVENRIIVEVKSVENILPIHAKQTLTYLRLMNLRYGLLINFNEKLLKNGITRLVNGY
ncbi:MULTISPECIES: GxxExxY protein [unclassified Leptospira]|uniref:GxxExxY protein n=1 Tax=unclassified Leptospira TaxID=2633828 RepID=UPI0002BF96D2|nr:MULTISPECIES: GxxExxY protein [unclassified Leptospira]EMJ97341.1 GxxExxY protein [Leptospira sp. B5-022]MCR1792888.1 GxxExxY protein [Leptospira sp. id769339]